MEINNQSRQVFYQAYKKLTGYKEPIIGKTIDENERKPKFNPMTKGFRKLQKLTKKLMKVEAKGFTLPEILQEPLIKELNDKSLERVKKKDISEVGKKVNVAEEQKHIPKSDTRSDKKGKTTPEKKTKASPLKKPMNLEKRVISPKVGENIKKKALKRASSERSLESNEHIKKPQVPLKKFKEDVILEVDEPMPESKKKTKPKKTETKKARFNLASNTIRSTFQLYNNSILAVCKGE